MPLLPFSEWRPDVSDLDGQHTRFIRNVLPRADGYGPFLSAAAFTEDLPAPCRGYFYARNPDNTVSLFAGTATHLYVLNNTTLGWTLVSRDGDPYIAIPPDGQWQFVQFNNFVIAVHATVDPQVFNLSIPTEFDDLGGSPPKAAYIAVVNRFVVLSGLPDSPYRVIWCGLNEIDNWTAGTNSSDFQDLPDGGIVRPVLGGEFGIILQDQSIRRMTFSPGSETIFDIQRISKDMGILAPYSAVSAGERAFFLSPKGFVQALGSGEMTPIGEEKINRTFLADLDRDALNLMIGASDPNSNTVMWVFKTLGHGPDSFNRAVVYNYVLQRWSEIDVEGEYLAQFAAPGMTMEGLDALAPGAMDIEDATDNGNGLIRIEVASTAGLTTGQYKTLSNVGGTVEANGTWQIEVIDSTHFDLIEDSEGNPSAFSNAFTSGGLVGGSLDALPFSLDVVSASALPNISLADTSHAIGFFSGPSLEATLETSEQSGDGRRIKVKGFSPVTDAPDVRGRVLIRDNLNTVPTQSVENTMNKQGVVPVIREARYARARMRIPAGVEWSFASGVVPDAILVGRQ